MELIAESIQEQKEHAEKINEPAGTLRVHGRLLTGDV